ncbi:MAG: hypothetical protein IJU70_07955 [Lentisphaeria bacterium]|nr:hypothetical protein [Lentisphaeria bacterium]
MRTVFLPFCAAVLAGVFLCGCTERERSGYSAIPQNSPAGWEVRPFGELRN